MLDSYPYTTYALAGTAVCSAYYVIKLLLAPPSPHLKLRGPPSPSRIFGHMIEINKLLKTGALFTLVDEWFEQYGDVIRIHDLFNVTCFVTKDLKALNHILTQTNIYRKPRIVSDELIRHMGEGILVAEGDLHRAQRRLMNPAFHPGATRELTGIFLDKANELREKWIADIGVTQSCLLDVTTGFSAVTLDIIGIAGFEHVFNTLSRVGDEEDELSKAFAHASFATSPVDLYSVVAYFLPFLHSIPTRHNRETWKYRAAMDRAGQELLRKKKAELMEGGEKGPHRVRDLISLLLEANMAADESQRITDEDILAQIPTFLSAGHDTTSNALAWIIFEISQRPNLQLQLRQELSAIGLSSSLQDNEPLTADELSALEKLPLLDAVVRESLRLHAPVPATIRIAERDDVIPVARPYMDKHGAMHESIEVRKGDIVPVHLMVVNRSKDLWGNDAEEWKPERWLSGVPESTKAIPNVWGPVMTFGAGPHSCIGYRFSVIETKIIMYTIINAFNFRLGVEAVEVGKFNTGIVLRPCMKAEREKGPGLPVIVSKV